ncbi:MAG TPA: response regulator [Pseudolabrys sp.]|nr:response regulator [Pseudolabrys sp.]
MVGRHGSERSVSGSPRILIIEDEWMIVDLIGGFLREFGYTVRGTAHNINSARREIAKRNYDAVLLDIGLGDEHSPELADLLKEAGTPFAFVTGYDHAFATRHTDVPLLRKPFSPAQLIGLLEQLVRPLANRDAVAGPAPTCGVSSFGM